MKIGRRILGSFCAVLVGWVACILTWVALVFLTSLPRETIPRAAQMACTYGFYVGIFAGICSVVTWLALFLWLYLLVPRTSTLWHWPQCTVCGAIAGFLIISVIWLCLAPGEWFHLIAFGGSAALVGGVTCLFASLTANRFHRV